MKQAFFGYILFVLPKKFLSLWIGQIVRIKYPGFFGRFVVNCFAKYYRINMDEAEKNLNEYPSIEALFTRKLKPGIRTIADTFLVHPADSAISSFGSITQGRCVQAKGKTYSVVDLIGGDQVWADRFKEGVFATYYLCPTDYHRVHSAVSGDVVKSSHIPGNLWPVNEWSVGTIDDLFAVNERTVTFMETEKGGVASVLVGATNVGQISLSYDERIRTNQSGQSNSIQDYPYEKPITLNKGEELGIFHMGSTVVLLLEKSFANEVSFQSGPVQMGQPILPPSK